jgi:hypothetical protein
MTTNAIDCLLFGLLILAAVVQAGAMLVMLWTAWDKKPLPRKSFRKALAIGLAATVAGAILYVVLGMRIGIIDLSGRPRGTLAADETEKPPTAWKTKVSRQMAQQK